MLNWLNIPFPMRLSKGSGMGQNSLHPAINTAAPSPPSFGPWIQRSDYPKSMSVSREEALEDSIILAEVF